MSQFASTIDGTPQLMSISKEVLLCWEAFYLNLSFWLTTTIKN